MKLVVIGGNAAGLSAASRARRVDPHLEITVLEKGDTVSYAACGLPYFLEGRVGSLDELVVYRPEFLRRERNLDVRTGAAVARIVHPRREVVLAGGQRVPYDRLVIATGARADTEGIPGAREPHVFPFRTFADALALRRFLAEKRPRRAAVVGAGYLGLELTEALRAHGLRVTLFEAGPGLLRRSDPTLDRILAAHLRRFGVEFRPGEPVKAIEPGKVNGRAADVVVIAAGGKPNVELAEEAGVELGRSGAIRVSEFLETNLAGVYAAGDCAEVVHQVTGRAANLPLGTTANKTGRVAGANAAGRRERFPGVVGTSIVRVCGLGVGLTGLSRAQARREGFDAVSAPVEARDRAPYFWGGRVWVELVADRRTTRLLGGSVVGEESAARRVNVVAAALAAGLKVEQFAQLDLAYSPPYSTVWDPLLIAARQLEKLLD